MQNFKPPSPKYDERSFFHDAPRHPYAAGPSAGTPWASPLQGSGLRSGLGLPAGSASPASGASAPGRRATVPSTGAGLGVVGTAAVHSTSAQRRQAQAPAAEMPAGVAAQEATPPNLHDAAAAQPAGQAAQTPAPQAVQGLPRAPDTLHPKPHEGETRAAKRARWASQITPPSEAAGAAPRTPISQAGFRRVVPGKGQGLTLLAVEARPINFYVVMLRQEAHFLVCQSGYPASHDHRPLAMPDAACRRQPSLICQFQVYNADVVLSRDPAVPTDEKGDVFMDLRT